ncbi:MAG: glycoside hydrolase family 3 C-terminal domain-containing protein [Clostridia bacterium]|nr:glycoside hydrolase family 3 C-terminal domain-containing protein [Clostridia bacterium]
MNVIKKKAYKLVGKIVNAVTNAATAQDSNSKHGNGYKPDEKIISLCRQMGAEGIVMLKNNNNVLPLNKERTVSVFGRVQRDYFYVGYGSGGDVNAPYKISLMDGLRANKNISVNEGLAAVYEKWCRENPVDDRFWGHWPMCYDEMPVSADLVGEAAENSDTAIVVIGRAAGEDRENKLEKGSYYLTDEEHSMLDAVTEKFSKVILLLNCGSIMDMCAINAYGDRISAILYVWQSGMESGNAVADVLSGKVSPSGKLTDTIATSYKRYPGCNDFGDRKFNCYTEDIYVGYRYFETFKPHRVLYPFGFGMSYTEFAFENIEFSADNGKITVSSDVKNIGERAGKEVAQVYFEAPCGRLGKPSRALISFAKTKLLGVGESERISLEFAISDMASYDDVDEFAYILEKGEYRIYLGADVRSAKLCGTYVQDADEITLQLSQTAAPVETFARMKAMPEGLAYETVPLAKYDLRQIILDNIPDALPKYNKPCTLADVKNGKVTLEQFVSTLNEKELEAISRGDYTMNSPLGAKGNAAVFGGVLESMRKKGIPPVTTTDGPSGIRLSSCASLMPIGTEIACSWNTDLAKELYAEVGKEMKILGSDVLLAPGINIHRNPLCGRNFEYYSEDPYLTGKIAAAVVSGMQSSGVSACPKHFACNNQETNRIHNDSRVSERALREIYLKGFEICVKEAKPQNIMTSYNKINGVWGHYHYELCTRILRGEWGYDGCIMTDWWMRSSKSPEFPNICDQAYRVRAGVNVLMPGGGRTGKRKPDGTLLKTLGKYNGITMGELQRNAVQILGYIINSAAMKGDYLG